MTRRAAAVVALAAALVALAVGLQPASGHQPGPPASLCPGSDAVISRGDWQVIAKPKALERVTSHAVGGLDGRTVLATDGKIVMRSTDGGCTWEDPVFSIETADLPGESAETPRVAMLSFPNPALSRPVMVVDGIGQSLGSRLLSSERNGAAGSWEQAAGLPLTGRYRDVIGSDADAMYVLTGARDEVGDRDPGATGQLYRGDGRQFEQVHSGRPIVSLATDGGALFAVRSNHDVEVSRDGGGSWEPLAISREDPGGVNEQVAETIDDPEGLGKDRNPWRWVAYKRDPASGTSAIALAASDERISNVSRVVVSLDEGKTWRDLPVTGLGPVGGITFANNPGQLVVALGTGESQERHSGLVVYDIALGQFRDVDDLELISLFEPRLYPLSAEARGHAGLFGVQLRAHRDEVHEVPDVIARYIPPDPPPAQFLRAKPCAEQLAEMAQEGVEDSGGGGRAARPSLPSLSGKRHAGHRPDAPLRPGENHVEPDPLSVRLEPGVPKREPLRVRLGAQPTPLDLGFLLDTSNTMLPALDGVLCSIDRVARRLRQEGLDPTFGVAAYNDRVHVRYRRILDLTPDHTKLLPLWKTLFSGRGAEEPIRTALFQVATGAGLQTKEQADDDAPPTAPRTVDVEVAPGQQLNFRPDAKRVVMVVGDEPYEEFTEDEPSVAQVIDALKGKAVNAFGIQVEHPVIEGVTGDAGMNPPRPLILRQQLETFARGSGALAPRGGVDCDGGGTPDVAEGQPLVCGIPFEGIRDSIGDTILALALTGEERREIRVMPESTAGLDIKVEGAHERSVNVRRESTLAGTLVFSCTAEQAGRRYPVSFRVMVGTRKVLSIPGVVTCGDLPSLAPSKADPRNAAPAAEPQGPSQEPSGAPTPGGGGSPQPQGAPAQPQPQPGPQVAAALSPPTPPPSPAPINSPSPASSPSAAPSAASAPAASSAAAPNPGVMAQEEEQAPGPQVAFADRGGSEGSRPATSHAVVGRSSSRRGDLSIVAARTRSRDRSVVPAPAAITLGVGFCGAAGWLVLVSGRRRRQQVAPVASRR